MNESYESQKIFKSVVLKYAAGVEITAINILLKVESSDISYCKFLILYYYSYFSSLLTFSKN